MNKSAELSRLIALALTGGASVDEAIDKVLGSGSFQSLVARFEALETHYFVSTYARWRKFRSWKEAAAWAQDLDDEYEINSVRIFHVRAPIDAAYYTESYRPVGVPLLPCEQPVLTITAGE